MFAITYRTIFAYVQKGQTKVGFLKKWYAFYGCFKFWCGILSITASVQWWGATCLAALDPNSCMASLGFAFVFWLGACLDGQPWSAARRPCPTVLGPNPRPGTTPACLRGPPAPARPAHPMTLAYLEARWSGQGAGPHLGFGWCLRQHPNEQGGVGRQGGAITRGPQCAAAPGRRLGLNHCVVFRRCPHSGWDWSWEHVDIIVKKKQSFGDRCNTYRKMYFDL